MTSLKPELPCFDLPLEIIEVNTQDETQLPEFGSPSKRQRLHKYAHGDLDVWGVCTYTKLCGNDEFADVDTEVGVSLEESSLVYGDETCDPDADTAVVDSVVETEGDQGDAVTVDPYFCVHDMDSDVDDVSSVEKFGVSDTEGMEDSDSWLALLDPLDAFGEAFRPSLLSLQQEVHGEARRPLLTFPSLTAPPGPLGVPGEAEQESLESLEVSGEAEQDDKFCYVYGLPLDSMCVRAQQERSEDIPQILWNLQQSPQSVLHRIVYVGEEVAEKFYVGITSSPAFRWIGGESPSGNVIVGHANKLGSHATMEVLFHGSTRNVARLERLIIAHVRDSENTGLVNRSDGGECQKADTPNFFLYVLFRNLPLSVSLPNFQRWTCTDEASLKI